jgi:transcriptional regulator with XRE-family HTH domain
MVAIGERIKQLRNEKELTQKDLSEQLHVSRSTISNWEIGRNYPDLDSVILLSDILEVSLDNLLREDRVMVEEVSTEQRKNAKRKRLLQIILPLFILSLLTTAYVLFQEVDEVHNFFSPSVTGTITIDTESENQNRLVEFDNKSYLNFRGPFWKKSVVNDANSDGQVEITVFSEDGNTVIEKFVLGTGQKKGLENLKKDTNYTVKIRAEKGSYMLRVI